VNDDVRRWVPPNASSVQLVNGPFGAKLFKAVRVDSDRHTVQVWTDTDTDGDGFADRIDRYANGKRIETATPQGAQR
jgi:hypothetical protein